MPLQHRRGYAADLHRGLPAGDITQPRSSPHHPDADANVDVVVVRVRAAIQPRSARFELVALLRGVQPLVPHVRLSVSLAEPGPSGSTGPPRRCRGRFHPRRRLPDWAAPSFTTACTTRSAVVGIPRRRSLPDAFGIVFSRTRCGTNVPALSCARSLVSSSAAPNPTDRGAIPSTPAVRAPVLPRTRFQATTRKDGS